ncbi:MAG TPA: glucans biosynthesis glucosyltransferase MdoH [Gammaproteobacteria bacterium]|nr:glucans biosynthesis glucosyltransferase MdoH [Gammaproteobacteria bacterium]
MESVTARQSTAIPPPALLDVPEQSFWRFTRERRLGWPAARTVAARLLTFGGALALTVYASREMIAVVSFGTSSSFLQWLMVVLFTITFGWIALPACAAVAGVLFGGTRLRARTDVPVMHRTALVMPVYNENPAVSFASLQAMAEMLLERDATGFEIFVLSDTTNPEVYLRETAAFHALREKLGDRMRVWYRRRTENTGRKVGNLHDFVTRWGGRYDFMIVLDADSIMSADTLLTLVREMAADPHLGLLQTVPRLAGGETLFARLQQFATAVYGPIVGRGIAAWQGEDGNYWGHNAIIRMRAFAAAAGLPTLPGRKPFGGPIMSHDFVEAALLRRAGWSVRMLPALAGTWEDSPPSLLDVAARDRRWAQGNIQHLAVIGARGFTWSNRIHMGIGVMSYVASPLWFALITVGLGTAVHIATVQFQYFNDELSLFPRWPQFDTVRMIRLFILAMAVLLLPKVLGVLRAFGNRELRRTVNPVRVLFGALMETVLSALYAPIMMMMQSRQLLEILFGQDSGWSTQSRKRSNTPWATLMRRHWMQTLSGFVVSVTLLSASPPLFAWMSPALVGLMLALPLSAASGSAGLGHVLRVLGLLVVPEEVAVPRVIALRNEIEHRLATLLEGITIERLLHDDLARQRHFAAVQPRPAPSRGKPDVMFMTARAKLGDAHSVAEALAWLAPQERMAVLGDRDLFHVLARLEHPDMPDRPALRSA